MVKKHKVFSRNRRICTGPVPVRDAIYELLEAMGGGRERAKLSELWQLWPKVVGEDAASQVEVLGHKNGVLLLGVEDAMQMQEMCYQAEEIRIKCNEFLRADYFKSVRLEVVGRKP